MFGGLERRRSSNVRFKQLFHELKQQFPDISDEVIANCIIEHTSTNNVKKNSKLIEALKASANCRSSSEEPMGRSSSQCEVPTLEQLNAPGSVVDTLGTSTNSSSPRRKSSKSYKHHQKRSNEDKSEKPIESLSESSPESEVADKKRERRSKLSNLLKKSTKIARLPSKSERDYTKRHLSKLSYLQSKKEQEEYSSSRETTPHSDQEETEVFQTVSALRQQFESSNDTLNKSVPPRRRSKSSTPPTGSDMNQIATYQPTDSQTVSPKRPTTLALNTTKPDARGWRNNLQPSEKCKNLPKLLNANLLSDKPPISPVHNKKLVSAKSKNVSTPNQDVKTAHSPNSDKNDLPSAAKDCTGARKKETVSTPTQTTDTLLGDVGNGGVNLSLNVNCSMDVIRSPVTSRRTSTLQVTPETPWGPQEPTSPRSYTSVNLTLRPPSSTPQPPIDITSQNASLTYSTSSFDSQKGLQSRLQITVGPSGGNVIASRVSPRSCDITDCAVNKLDAPVVGSPNGMMETKEPVIVRQQARIEKLRIELTNEKTRLVVLKREVSDLEKKTGQSFAEVQRRELKHKINHLRYQCQKLVQDLNDFSEPEFYNNLYRGQALDENGNRLRPRFSLSQPRLLPHQDHDGPMWSCHLCTFLNHPEMTKCEQCEMARLIHGTIFPLLGNSVHRPPSNLRLQN
ncbi:hypothetical protein WA026_010881 [Henosepilachna vigintioctopunctata]|uniref:RanBP2-type domain-containing protein n=1 Tax=Henosepilachna vigintioctopunctata TaxID=420089 RepID=A0AAW1URD7_9CUCU